jgi:hypothetical protein
MAKKKVASDSIEVQLDLLVRLTQDLLILQALQAGVTSHEVAAMVKIDKRRVSNVSKYLKDAKK